MALFREPLVLFLLAGAAIFAVGGIRLDTTDDTLIEVSPAQLQRMSDQWQAQMGRPATPEELSGLTEQWIREEIYYREARAMGLDDNDTIIRRRLAQKLTFLTEDLADAAPAEEGDLEAYYREHPEKYTRPQTFTFEHRYFSDERRADAEAVAQAALADPDITSDPFMLQLTYVNRSLREIRDLFGREFAERVSILSTSDDWQGPIRSAYGWHAVRLDMRSPVTLKPFGTVRQEVAADLSVDRRRAANDALYSSLRARYDVRFPANPPDR